MKLFIINTCIKSDSMKTWFLHTDVGIRVCPDQLAHRMDKAGETKARRPKKAPHSETDQQEQPYGQSHSHWMHKARPYPAAHQASQRHPTKCNWHPPQMPVSHLQRALQNRPSTSLSHGIRKDYAVLKRNTEIPASPAGWRRRNSLCVLWASKLWHAGSSDGVILYTAQLGCAW